MIKYSLIYIVYILIGMAIYQLLSVLNIDYNDLLYKF
jgi:hypothetical protein